MSEDKFIPVSVGLLDPKHVKAMTHNPLFVYLWFLRRVTKDSPNGDGHFSGHVLGGQPVELSRVGAELGIETWKLRRYVALLVSGGYLERKKTGGGANSYVVTNSKKWLLHRNGQGTAKPSGEAADPRHAPAESLIQELFKIHFSVTCPWDGSEGKALKTLLKGNPSWTTQQIEQMIRHRFASEGISGDRPRLWLSNLAKYSAAPLDKFQKPKTAMARVPMGQGAMNNYRKLLADAGVGAK